MRGGSRTAATSKMERFVIIVKGWKPLTMIPKCSILNVAAVRLRKIQTTATTLETNWGSTNNLNMLKEFLQQILKLAKVVFKDVFRNTSKYLRSPLNIIRILQNAQEM